MNTNQTGVPQAPGSEIKLNIQPVNIPENQLQPGQSESFQPDQTEQVTPGRSEITVNQGEAPVGAGLNSNTQTLQPEISTSQTASEPDVAVVSSQVPSVTKADSKALADRAEVLAYKAVTSKAETLNDMNELATTVANLGWKDEPQKN